MKYQFRVWNVMSKKMLGWGEIFDLPAWEIFPGTPEQRPFNVMQYTGLKDKNGKEIYEGDVLDLSLGDDSVLRCEVIYEAPSFCRKWYNANTIRLRQREIEPMAWNTHIVYEVIGNIYENPELLER
ncbi:YopX family protein [Bacillus cereus]|uniref:YopX family protein n=1 Tax=Bacillus cereus TaxID=1396 RepID=UPI003CF3B86B